MQLFAFDGTFPISATHAVKGKNYLCPECGASVRVRKGPSRQTHFYHLRTLPNCRQHQKSLEHVQMQLKIFELTSAQIEAPFPSIGRIADCAWHEKKIVFEVQCSPISLEEAKSRVLDYRSLQYEVIWILHDKRFNAKTLLAAEKYLRTTGCYFTNIDKEGLGIVYDQFEVIKENRRIYQGPPLTVSLTKVFLLPTVTVPDLEFPQVVLERLTHWKCYVGGDLLQRLLKEGNMSEAAKKMLHIETRLLTQKSAAPEKKLPLKILFFKIYQSLLHHLLDLL